jgi:uncharacterized membrane protein
MATPGWYPDPSGQPVQRYFHGTRWTDQVANLAPPVTHPAKPVRSTSLRRFVTLLVGGSIVAIIAYVVMQQAFWAADGPNSLLLEIVGFLFFGLWLVAVVTALVGLVGTIVRLVRKKGAPSLPVSAAASKSCSRLRKEPMPSIRCGCLTTSASGATRRLGIRPSSGRPK